MRCVVFIAGADEVFGTSILPAMAAHLYSILYSIRRLIPLRWGVLQEAQLTGVNIDSMLIMVTDKTIQLGKQHRGPK